MTKYSNFNDMGRAINERRADEHTTETYPHVWCAKALRSDSSLRRFVASLRMTPGASVRIHIHGRRA